MPRPTPPKTSPALDDGVFDIQAKVANAVGGSGGEATYGKSNGELVFTVHAGKKGSKKKPYTGIEEFCHSYRGKDLKVNFKIRSEKTEDDAKKLVKQMITDLEREFATEPKEKRKQVEASADSSLSSRAGSRATLRQPPATINQAITTPPTILIREESVLSDASNATKVWAAKQFLIENFTREPSVGTEDERSGNE